MINSSTTTVHLPKRQDGEQANPPAASLPSDGSRFFGSPGGESSLFPTIERPEGEEIEADSVPRLQRTANALAHNLPQTDPTSTLAERLVQVNNELSDIPFVDADISDGDN